jgi:hypothetical protein
LPRQDLLASDLIASMAILSEIQLSQFFNPWGINLANLYTQTEIERRELAESIALRMGVNPSSFTA